MRFVGTMPAIEVMVNGKGPFLFGIDTGGQGTARIDSSLIEKLGLKPSGAVLAGDPSEKNPQTLQEVLLQSVEVAGLRFADVKAVARNFKASPRMAEVDGILTLNLFADYLFTLDYPGKSVRISKGELPPADGAEILNYSSGRRDSRDGDNLWKRDGEGAHRFRKRHGRVCFSGLPRRQN
ncbi:MAG: retropepsin-like aspartic protease [Chthoniobacterales bacterium]